MNVTGSSAITYGPASGTRIITGNLTITGNATSTIDLRNIRVNGNLVIDTPTATVNVLATTTVDGATNIVAVNHNSFVSSGTHTSGINVKGQGRIELSGTASTSLVTIDTIERVTLEGAINNVTLVRTGDLTVNINAAVITVEDSSQVTGLKINEEVTIISSTPVTARVKEGVDVIVKTEPNGEGTIIPGTGEEIDLEPETNLTVKDVKTNDELVAALSNEQVLTINIMDNITVVDTVKPAANVTINGNGYKLTFDNGSGQGDNTAEGLYIANNDVVIKNIVIDTVTHGDNLIEIYSKTTLEKVTVKNGKKAGIYVNNDGYGTIEVNFKDITTENNAWNAGIGLVAQNDGSKVIANFSGNNSFSEDVAVYHEGTKYLGTYEVNGLEGYTKVTVDNQQKWVKAPPITVKYTLTLSEGLTSVPAGEEIDEDTEVVVTVTVPEGKEISTFTVNEVDKKDALVGNKYTFTITENTTIAVTFEDIPVEDPTIAKVSDAIQLQNALENDKVETIIFESDITANIVIERTVTIDGDGNILSGYIEVVAADDVIIKNLTVNADKSSKSYGIQFYKMDGGELENVTVTDSKGGILVNGSKVTVSKITLEDNEWGGIEVSKGTDVSENPELTVAGRISHDDDETPVVWIDGTEENDGWVVGGGFVEKMELPEGKANQVWFKVK